MTASPGNGAFAAVQARLDAPDIQDVMKGRTVSLARVGSVLVVAHNAQPPAQEEWVRYCELLSKHLPDITAQLVLAEGPGPSAAQRQQALESAPKGSVIPPTVVFTRSALVRGVVTLFNWFTPRAMRALPPGDVLPAAQHLRMPEEQLRRLVDIGETLRPADT